MSNNISVPTGTTISQLETDWHNSQERKDASAKRLAEIEAHTPSWTKFNGHNCLKAVACPLVAFPHSGRRRSKLWDVVDTEAKEVVAQLTGKEIEGFLTRSSIDAAKNS